MSLSVPRDDMPIRDSGFLLSLFLSRLGDQVLLFLVPLVIFQVTGSVSWSGYAFFIEALPRFIAFPVCGVLCDFKSPYRLLRISQVMRALACVAGLAGFYAMGGIGWLIALSALTGIMTTQGVISREVILAQAFASQRYEKILSYTQIADQLGTVLGPVLAALLLGGMDWQGIVAGVAVLFLAADFSMSLWWRQTRPHLAPARPFGRNWLVPFGIAARHVWQLPGLRAVVLLAASVNLVIGVTLATAPSMVTGLQGQSDFYYGLLQGAGAVATVLILLGIAHIAVPLHVLGIWGYLLICAGGFMTGFGHSVAVYGIGFVLVIGFDKMFSIFLRATRKRIIPPADFGKTTGLLVLLNNLTQPLAGLVVGLWAADGDARGIVFGLCCVMLVVGIGAGIGARAILMRVGDIAPDAGADVAPRN